MTIDEAIKICEEDAEKIGGDPQSDRHAGRCRQIAEWLTDYKELKNSIGAVKLSNIKEALALIRTLKAELNGWKEDPFGIIAEVCRAVTDCRRCQWYEKCPFSKYECYPEEWRN